MLDVLERENERLSGVRVHQMHALQERPYIHGAFGDRLRHVSYFLSGATRKAYWEGGCDLVPNHFSEMPRLLEQVTRHPVVLAAASPPDRAGYFSLGTNADYVASLIGKVPFFLEVNERMPRTFGLNQIHASQLLGYCEADRPLVEVPPAQPDERDRAIAAAIVERIPDGATLQVGIGGIPNAVLDALREPSRPRHPHGAAGRRDRRPRRGGAWRPACASSCGATRWRRRSASAPSGSTTGCTTTAPSSCCRSTSSTTRAGSPARRTSSRSTPRPRSTSTASARRRRSPGATGPRAAARPTSPAARCTRRAARPSSCCTRRRAPGAAGSACG